MKLTIVNDSVTPFLREAMGKLAQARQAALVAAGRRFAQAAKDNIGEIGNDRPKTWAALRNKRYARKVGRDYATLQGKGAVLKSSIKADAPANSSIEVGSDVVYSAIHQFGGGKQNMPARPYFPVSDNGDLTPKTEAALEAAIAAEYAKLLA